MLVENANCFGMAQLHQLRGRVGRGSRNSRCFLMTPDGDEASLKRLQVCCSCHSASSLLGSEISRLQASMLDYPQLVTTRFGWTVCPLTRAPARSWSTRTTAFTSRRPTCGCGERHPTLLIVARSGFQRLPAHMGHAMN